MIRPASNNPLIQVSAWVGGLCLFCLAVGVQGAFRPLEPRALGQSVRALENSSTVALEDELFILPPPLGAEENEVADSEEAALEPESSELPPLPEISPLDVPEMAELDTLEKLPTPAAPLVKPPPTPKPAEGKPKTIAKPTNTTKGVANGLTGGSGDPTLFTGSGPGTFPRPTYPAAARASRQQGLVKLSVVVEATGTPSMVSVLTSSGYASLDRAAKDTVSRGWRWPAGVVRRFTVPLNFVLK
jgi:TonB family protein